MVEEAEWLACLPYSHRKRERERSFYNSTAMSEAFLWYSFGLKEANTEQSGDVFTPRCQR